MTGSRKSEASQPRDRAGRFAPRRTNSHHGIGTRSGSAVDRLAAGLPARPSSKSTGAPGPHDKLQADPPPAPSTSGSVKFKQPEQSSAPTAISNASPEVANSVGNKSGSATLRVNAEDLTTVQGICQSETASLSNKIRDIRQSLDEEMKQLKLDQH